jgi:hypothetical protein
MPLAVGKDLTVFLVKEFNYTHQDQKSFQELKILEAALFAIEFLHCFQRPVWNLFLLFQFLNSAKRTLYSYLPQVSADPLCDESHFIVIPLIEHFPVTSLASHVAHQ